MKIKIFKIKNAVKQGDSSSSFIFNFRRNIQELKLGKKWANINVEKLTNLVFSWRHPNIKRQSKTKRYD